MVDLHIGGGWGPREEPLEVLAQRSLDFSRRLQAVHPLFAEISPFGNKSGYNNMLKQPVLWGFDEVQWRKLLEAARAQSPFFVTVKYWNRRVTKGEACFYTITANNTSSMGNGVSINDIPDALNNVDCLKAILKAAIEVFGLEQGEVFTMWPGHVEEPILFWHWLWWLREGQPWPPEHSRFNHVQGRYSSAEPWLGGTLYTWPEYEPWRLASPPTSRV